MKPSAIAVCSLLLMAGLPLSARADLATDVKGVLANPLLARSKWSVDIVKLGADGGGGPAQTLFESNANAPMAPASNLKVVTTSAALERLGKDFKFRTLLVQHGDDLILIGDGDPTLGDAELLKKSGWDVTTVFKIWADGLAKRKAGPFRSLLVDDSVFDSQFINPHWSPKWADLRYGAGVAGINLNVNCIDFYVKPRGVGETVEYATDPPTGYISVTNKCISGGDNRPWVSRLMGTEEMTLHGTASQANVDPISITINDPPLYAGTVLGETLTAEGIEVGTIARTETARAAYHDGAVGWKLLAVHETSLLAVMSRANKDSMNLYAEATCKRLGFAAAGAGTWANGTGAVGEFLRGIGASPDEFHLDDGCGLSPENGISAHLMVQVLSHDFYGPNSKDFRSTLAVAGVDGTMKDRFRGTNLRGRVLGKSGFVNGVSCLSGYLRGRDDSWYAFSILFNDVPAGGTGDAKVLEERIVGAVDAAGE